MDAARGRTVAGASLVAGGAITVLGFVAAAALVPGYSATGQTISTLGSTAGTPASRAVFAATTVLTGGLAVLAGYGIDQADVDRPLAALVAATGIGLVGVGVFPARTGPPHLLAALVAFAGLGVSALAAGRAIAGPFGGVSVALGVAELAALGAFLALGAATPLGIGGLERWVAYLGTVWAVAFGGFLLPGGSAAR